MKTGILVMILVCLAVLGGGCIGQQPEISHPATVTPTPLPTTVPTPTGTQPEPTTVPPTIDESLGGPIEFEPRGEYVVGDRILLSGITNLAPGNELLIEVRSVSFGPTPKTEDSRIAGVSATVVVEKGAVDSRNTWSYLLDTTGFVPDRYQVEISGITVPAFRKSTSFTLNP
ncbi:MAG: hypothetical protein GKC07_07030 [Methanomicrobiales archaeon]|nr:hypothetical protein [Methanomicrobiales archaeon]